LIRNPQFLAKPLHTSIQLQQAGDDRTKKKEILNSSITQSTDRSDQQISTHVTFGTKGFCSFFAPQYRARTNEHVSFLFEAKEKAKDASYLSIILVGFGIVAFAVYYLWKELGSRETPTGIYSESSKYCLEHAQVCLHQINLSASVCVFNTWMTWDQQNILSFNLPIVLDFLNTRKQTSKGT
jgi:hypothetical protein